MTSIEKGDWVIARQSGSGHRARGWEREHYSEGDELLVTSTRSAEWLSVRKTKYSPVFSIRRSHVMVETRRVGAVPPGDIEADDPRIAWLFEDAARLATRLGLCGDFDRLVNALGAPGRPREFTVKVASEPGLEVTAKVTARSRREAERLLIERAGFTGRAIEAAS